MAGIHVRELPAIPWRQQQHRPLATAPIGDPVSVDRDGLIGNVSSV